MYMGNRREPYKVIGVYPDNTKGHNICYAVTDETSYCEALEGYLYVYPEHPWFNTPPLITPDGMIYSTWIEDDEEGRGELPPARIIEVTECEDVENAIKTLFDKAVEVCQKMHYDTTVLNIMTGRNADA